jgi:hypothetical protein
MVLICSLLSTKTTSLLAQSSVCAEVKLSITQQAVVAGQAFAPTLALNNGSSSDLQQVSVVLNITDVNNQSATNLFAIIPPLLSGLTAVDGTGVVAAGTAGQATWTIRPTRQAAPSNTTQYFVSGALSYNQNGTLITLPLYPTSIQVLPEPFLTVKYFEERVVYSDDPFTPQIEPAVPFNLGVLVTNGGYGTAKALGLGSTVMQTGTTSSVPLTLISSVGLTNLSFAVVYPANRFTNWVVAVSNSAIGTTIIQTVSGAETLIGAIYFVALPGLSGFVPLGIANIAATEQDGTLAGNASGQGGRVAVIGAEPLVEAWLGTNSQRMLTLYGNPAATYALGYRTNVLATNWQFACRTPMTNLFETFSADAKAPLLFYRAWEFFADPPIMELARPGAPNLTLLLYGEPGANYILQATTNLANTNAWSMATNFLLTNSFLFINEGPTTNKALFYRGKRQ